MNDRGGRARVPVAALVAVLLGVAAIAGACGTPSPSPSPTALGTSAATAVPTLPTSAPSPPLATPRETQVSSAPACISADLKASHGIVEGAAGSRITEVILVSASACSVDAFPVLGLRDADGAGIVGGTAAGGGRLDLVAGTPYTSAVRLANWCLPEPSFPLTLQIRLGEEELPVTGGSFPGEEDGLPPCNGEGPPILEGGAWTAP